MLEDSFIFVNDDFDNVKNYTMPLLLKMINKIKNNGIAINLYVGVLDCKSFVLEYMAVFVFFKSIKEVVLYLKDTYINCKIKEENEYYKKQLLKCIEECSNGSI